MNVPTISIVMPLYNNANDIARALQSVFAQTYTDYELIIVNDGSTDNSMQVVQQYNNERLRIIEQTNQGVSAARNRGITEARGSVIAFLDADDEWMPNFLSTIATLRITYPECAVFATHYIFREMGGTMRLPVLRGVPQKWNGVLQNYFTIAAQSDPPLWSSAIAVEKKALESVGLFPVGVKAGEDLLTWTKFALQFKIAYSSEPQAIFWLKAPIAGEPSRVPDMPDVVGDELRTLLQSLRPHEQRDFRRYCSLWHRMRAAMYLQLQQEQQARRELKILAKYTFFNPQLYIYFVLSFVPRKARTILLNIFSSLKILRRKSIAL